MTAFRPRILVVDDEPQIHRFLGPALEAAGYEHVRVEDGLTALREIARKPPDAVVLDLGLPDIDGKEALAKARAFYEGPIIILSARDKETEKIDALDAGADDMKRTGSTFEITCDPAHFNQVQDALKKNNINPQVAELAQIGKALVDAEVETARKVMKLVEALDDHDDVQNVYTNLNLTEEVAAEMANS